MKGAADWLMPISVGLMPRQKPMKRQWTAHESLFQTGKWSHQLTVTIRTIVSPGAARAASVLQRVYAKFQAANKSEKILYVLVMFISQRRSVRLTATVLSSRPMSSFL